MLTFLDHWERYCDLRLADEFPFNQQGYVPNVQVEVNLKNIKNIRMLHSGYAHYIQRPFFGASCLLTRLKS